LIVGGTDEYDKVIVNGAMQDAGHGFAGTKDVAVFDPVIERWTSVHPMSHGRWYPTAVLLGNGTVLAASGLDEHAGGLENNTLETTKDAGHTDWRKTRDFNLPLYPHLFQLTDGRLFYTGGKMDTPGESLPLVFDPIHQGPADVIDGLTDADRCNQCASVVLPPAQDQAFMILGGGPEDDTPFRGQATRRVCAIDFKLPAPKYQIKAALNHERMHVNAVLLPDRTVLACGGGVSREASVQTRVVDPLGGREVFEAEIYDVANNTWTITAPATIARLYHSVALLLPDGRVVAAGGNPDKGMQVPWLPPDPLEEMRLEIFSPPYLFKKKSRPTILNVQEDFSYGVSVRIRATAPKLIKWISLIAAGLTTHSFNCTQRVVDMPFTVSLPDTLNAQVPVDHSHAPPGWYMLFVTDNDGVPSVGIWVHLS
jgi:hypothetical protein